MDRLSAKMSRNAWLTLDDAALLRQCRVDTYRASGPGGQKRNKTSSAVRLRHEPSGLIAIAEESRSQHENKARALRRLRTMIALEIRADPSEDELIRCVQPWRTSANTIEISARNPAWPLVAALCLDILHIHAGRTAPSAAAVGITTAQFTRFLTSDVKLLASANRIRAANSLKPLRNE